MKKVSGFIFIFLLVSKLYGQTIQVKEIENNFPIDRVLIYNKSKNIYIYTDKNGKADISLFSNKDLLNFQHLSYIDQTLSKSEVKAYNNIILLENASEQIEEVILSASRSEEKRARIAEQVVVITQHEIQKKSPQTSADLLALTPGVKVQKTQFGGGSPVLRGMESNRVLLVVDGVRLNNAIYRKGHLQNSITVSPNLLARTEVLFGPSSIIYGSDALGGVIHYYTKKPKLSEETLYNSSIFSRYSSVNNEISATYTGEYSAKKWASLTAVSVNRFGDLTMGKNRTHGFDDWGLVPFYSSNSEDYYEAMPQVNSDAYIQRNTGYDQLDMLQKIVIPLTNKTELNFNIQYSNSTNIPRFDKLNEYTDDGSLNYAEWYYGPQKRFLAASQLSINPSSKWLESGQFTVAYQDIYESRVEREFDELTTYFRNENVKVWSFNGDFHVPLTPNKKRILSYGFETSYNKITSDATGSILNFNDHQVTGYSDDFTIQSRFPDGGSSYSNFALYSNYRFDHSKKGTLNVGLRYTNTLLKATWVDTTFITLPEMDISSSNAAFSGTVGYVYKPNNNWKLSSVLSSGFRSPNIDDIGKIREKRGNVSVPNTELNPEYAYNAEVGLLYVTPTKKTTFGFNTYYTLLHNYIARDFYSINGESSLIYDGELANTIANINKGNAYILGGTLLFNTQIAEHLKLQSSATYTKGKAYDDTESLSSIPPLFGNVNLSYQLKKWELGLDFRFNTHKKPQDYNITEGIDNIEETPIIDATAVDAVNKYYGTPAWQTFAIQSQYKISRNAQIQLQIANIFDIHYKEFASGVSASGRNFSLSLNMHF